MKGKLVLFLGAMVVAIAVIALGTAFAAPDDNDALDSGLLDPFTLNMIDILSTAGLSDDSHPSMVRIPFRPTLRSPFRPPVNP